LVHNLTPYASIRCAHQRGLPVLHRATSRS
jgi:hypothetical protein